MEWWQVQELMITVAVIVGVLVPVLALTYRFLTKTAPRSTLPGGQEATNTRLHDERLDYVERQLDDLQGMVRRLVDVVEFDRQLGSGGSPDEENR